jgi:hypothetical protein
MLKFSVSLMLVLSVCGIVTASDIRVDYNSTLGRASIWIEAEDYDSKTAEFVVDPQVMNASGDALYFDQYSPNVQIDQWWAEYSIDSAAVTEPAITLSGNWYCWVRVNQPQAGVEEANYLLVKGDPNDGSGSDWYSAAIAGVSDGDDILNNDIAGNGGAGIGTWIWMGASTKTAGVEKEFNLDTEGRIVFRINEREGGPDAGRIDAICWTNDPIYVPNDAVFGQVAIADGLVLEMNAAYPGINCVDQWRPYVASDPFGKLSTGEFVRNVNVWNDPVIKRTEGSESGKYIWYYDFDGSIVKDIYPVDELVFDENEEFTVEAWIRVNSNPTGTQIGDPLGRGTIISQTNPSDSGWRFGIRDTTSTYTYGTLDKFGLDFSQRSNPGPGTFGLRTTESSAMYPKDTGEWYQVVVYRGPVTLHPVSGYNMVIKFWVNGVLIRNNTSWGNWTEEQFSQFNFDGLGQNAKLGSVSEASLNLAFLGDISVVRVYDRMLSDAEVAANYNYGIESEVEKRIVPTEYDFNFDGIVNVADFALLASEWLEEGIIVTGQ